MIPIYIISLDDHKHKRDKIENQLNSLNIKNYSFIRAYDGRKKKNYEFSRYIDFLRMSLYGKPLSGPEIGCYLSHRNVFEKIIDQNVKCAVVLEDDAIIDNSFLEVLPIIKKKIQDLELIRFIGKEKIDVKPKRKIFKINSKQSIYRLHGAPGGTYAYMISLNGAKKLFYKMKNIFTAIDTLMGLQVYTGIGIYTVYPKIASWDDRLGSTIGSQRFKKKLSGFYKITYPITRFCFKIIEENSKLYFYLINYIKDLKSYKSSLTLPD